MCLKIHVWFSQLAFCCRGSWLKTIQTQPCSNRKKPVGPREAKEEAAPPSAMRDQDKCEYSTVDECTSVLSRVSSDQRAPATPEGLPAAPGPSGLKEACLNAAESQLYSEPVDSLWNAMPDISPYACFYGAPRHQLLKVGWLDKLSPQG